MTRQEISALKKWISDHESAITWLVGVLIIGAFVSGAVADSVGARHCNKSYSDCIGFHDGFSMPYFKKGMMITAVIGFAPFYLMMLNALILFGRTKAGLTREERQRRELERIRREREQAEELRQAKARLAKLERDMLSHPELGENLSGLT